MKLKLAIYLILVKYKLPDASIHQETFTNRIHARWLYPIQYKLKS